MLHSPRADLVAGVTVGVVALPLALAFGIASGLGATAGLVTAVVAGVVAARVRRQPRAGVRPDRCDDRRAGADRGRARCERRGRGRADGRAVPRRDGPGRGRPLRAVHPAARHRGVHPRHRRADRPAAGARGPRRHRRDTSHVVVAAVARGGRLVLGARPRRPGPERRRRRADPARLPAAPRGAGGPAGGGGGDRHHPGRRPAGGHDRRPALAAVHPHRAVGDAGASCACSSRPPSRWPPSPRWRACCRPPSPTR